jgi:hypothetical protein
MTFESKIQLFAHLFGHASLGTRVWSLEAMQSTGQLQSMERPKQHALHISQMISTFARFLDPILWILSQIPKYFND